MNDFNKIIKETKYSDENFEGWKYTEILYTKIDWIKPSVYDIDELFEILEEVQLFIEKLQELEDLKK